MRSKYIPLLGAAFCSLFTAINPAFAQGSAFTYQGFLTDGGVAANGVYDLEFRVFNALAAGAQQGATVTVNDQAVANGLFTVTLDPGAGVFTGPPRWLNIAVRQGASVGAYTDITPRQPITPTPYAIHAGTAGHIPAAEPATGVTPVLGMAWIKPGTFILGSPASDPDSIPDERPQTVVTLTKGFYIGVHEVTQLEYQTVIGSNPSFFTHELNRPVERVSWPDATNYCRLLTLSERAAGRLPANWGYRLPTEAEWEYACRAGARTTRFGYGDDLGETAFGNYAWFVGNSGSATHSVEQKAANPWGLMDMHGNVAEWCQDWFAPYPGGSVVDPQGPGAGTARVVRGGSWGSLSAGCRSARRGNYDPASAEDVFGFRVVLSSGQP